MGFRANAKNCCCVRVMENNLKTMLFMRNSLVSYKSLSESMLFQVDLVSQEIFKYIPFTDLMVCTI